MTARAFPNLPRERRTVYNMLRAAAETWTKAPALDQPLGNHRYRTYSWLEYRRIVEELAAGLHALGIGKGDVVGLASETRAEFYLADAGVMTSGAIAAAVYTSLAASDQVQTLINCEAKVIFVEHPRMMKTLVEAGAGTLPVIWILLTGECPDCLNPAAMSFENLRGLGEKALLETPELLEQMCDQVRPEDPAILYLTSGATGEPKMGLVTHNAVVFNCDMGPQVLTFGRDDCTLAFLPAAHITQRLVMQLLMIRMGVRVFFSESLTRMPLELRSIRPTFFVAPPRVWERIYASVTTEIRKKPALVRNLFYTAMGAGAEANRLRQQGKPLPLWLKSSLAFFDRAVFAKIRARLGGRLRIAASGAAPLGKDLAAFYAAINLPLIEGYGLTEGGVVALNPIDRPIAGSIGKALPGVALRTNADGELLIQAETVFAGYYKDPAATAMVLRDGWLHTGDLAEIDHDGYVWITGRKKELIVSSNGKKIYPSKIEALFKLEPIVNQVLLIGDRLPYMTALFTLSSNASALVDGAKGLQGKELSEAPAVQDEIKSVVRRINKQLAPFEQVRKFRILERDFSIESGELTPTMKVRRGRVLENFKKEIGELYAGREDD